MGTGPVEGWQCGGGQRWPRAEAAGLRVVGAWRHGRGVMDRADDCSKAAGAPRSTAGVRVQGLRREASYGDEFWPPAFASRAVATASV